MEIAAQIDGHPISVDQACARLHKDGYISTIGGGRYRVTDVGRERLTDDYQQYRT
jgi:Mn-dependent DtxR family transcriptional regulator